MKPIWNKQKAKNGENETFLLVWFEEIYEIAFGCFFTSFSAVTLATILFSISLYQHFSGERKQMLKDEKV